MPPRFNRQLKLDNYKPALLVEQVSKVLADAIIDGTLKGGDQLVEEELRKQFNISRSPLREAFRDLEKKGLVEIIPRRGTFVRRITRKEIEEHFSVRAVLEGLAAKEATGKISREDLNEMTEILRTMEICARRKDARGYREHHFLFHEIFIDASGNDLLIDILRTLRMHSMWFRFTYHQYKDNFSASLKVHSEILEMFTKKSDPKDIQCLVEKHILVFKDRFISYLDKLESAPNGSLSCDNRK